MAASFYIISSSSFNIIQATNSVVTYTIIKIIFFKASAELRVFLKSGEAIFLETSYKYRGTSPAALTEKLIRFDGTVIKCSRNLHGVVMQLPRNLEAAVMEIS
jgi:hypothetical protein